MQPRSGIWSFDDQSTSTWTSHETMSAADRPRDESAIWDDPDEATRKLSDHDLARTLNTATDLHMDWDEDESTTHMYSPMQHASPAATSGSARAATQSSAGSRGAPSSGQSKDAAAVQNRIIQASPPPTAASGARRQTVQARPRSGEYSAAAEPQVRRPTPAYGVAPAPQPPQPSAAGRPKPQPTAAALVAALQQSEAAARTASSRLRRTVQRSEPAVEPAPHGTIPHAPRAVRRTAGAANPVPAPAPQLRPYAGESAGEHAQRELPRRVVKRSGPVLRARPEIPPPPQAAPQPGPEPRNMRQLHGIRPAPIQPRQTDAFAPELVQPRRTLPPRPTRTLYPEVPSDPYAEPLEAHRALPESQPVPRTIPRRHMDPAEPASKVRAATRTTRQPQAPQSHGTQPSQFNRTVTGLAQQEPRTLPMSPHVLRGEREREMERPRLEKRPELTPPRTRPRIPTQHGFGPASARVQPPQHGTEPAPLPSSVEWNPNLPATPIQPPLQPRLPVRTAQLPQPIASDLMPNAPAAFALPQLRPSTDIPELDELEGFVPRRTAKLELQRLALWSAVPGAALFGAVLAARVLLADPAEVRGAAAPALPAAPAPIAQEAPVEPPRDAPPPAAAAAPIVETLRPVHEPEPRREREAATKPARESRASSSTSDSDSERIPSAARAPRASRDELVAPDPPVAKSVREEPVEKVEKPSRSSGESSAGIGVLRLNSRPWSQVYVDGKHVGNTPLMGHRLPAGKHDVELINPAMNMKKRLTVNIAADEITTRVEMLSE